VLTGDNSEVFTLRRTLLTIPQRPQHGG
jgi:hypothetical protein